MNCCQQNFREPNIFGHVYDGKKSTDGYAICSACDCIENTSEAGRACCGTMLGRKLIRLSQNQSPLPQEEGLGIS